MTAGLPAIRKIQENGYKLHACCGHTHSAIDLAIALRGRAGLSEADAGFRIESIEVDTYGPGYEIVKESHPRTPYQAKFSMAYCVAVALLEGRAGLEQFAGDRFAAEGVRLPALASLLERTHVTVADDLTAKYPAAWPARVTVTLRDGSRLCDASDYPRGNPRTRSIDASSRRSSSALVSSRFDSSRAARALAASSGLLRIERRREVLSPVYELRDWA